MIAHIYHLIDNEENKPKKFMNYHHMEKHNLKPAITDYEKVYDYPLADSYDNIFTALEDIFYTFNENRPTDYTYHSLSVSDIVVIERSDNLLAAYYVDSFGFKILPEFFDDKATLSYIVMNPADMNSPIFEKFEDMRPDRNRYRTQICTACAEKHKTKPNHLISENTNHEQMCGIKNCSNIAEKYVNIPYDDRLIMHKYINN